MPLNKPLLDHINSLSSLSMALSSLARIAFNSAKSPSDRACSSTSPSSYLENSDSGLLISQTSILVAKSIDDLF